MVRSGARLSGGVSCDCHAVSHARSLSCRTASSSRSQLAMRSATVLAASNCMTSSVSVPWACAASDGGSYSFGYSARTLLPAMIFPVAQEPPLWPVDRRPPCLLAA